jgi:hypothetical protein
VVELESIVIVPTSKIDSAATATDVAKNKETLVENALTNKVVTVTAASEADQPEVESEIPPPCLKA